MANVCSFNRQEDNMFYRYIVYCINGVDDAKMALINKKHKEERNSYTYSDYTSDDLHFLVRSFGYNIVGELIIIEHKKELHHRMEDAPEWVIRHQSGYYYGPTHSEILYNGDDFYENATSDN